MRRICVARAQRLAVLTMLACSQAWALPPRVEIEPNAEQNRSQPMHVRLGGRPGQDVTLLILRDCNGDGVPELHGQDRCQTPLRRETVRLSSEGRAEKDVSLVSLPEREPLYLRASFDPTGERDAQDVYFRLVNAPCERWEGIRGIFGRGRCQVSLRELLAPGRSQEGLERPAAVLEVRRQAVGSTGPAGKPLAVPGTQGATGVAYLNEEALLVTLGRASAAPGLYRVKLPTGERTLLQAASPDETLVAPLALDGSRVAYVSEPRMVSRFGVRAEVVVLEPGKEPQRTSLFHTVHQLLRHERGMLIGCSRKKGVPWLFYVDLAAQRETLLGNAAELYGAMMQTGSFTIVSVPDAGGRDSWDLWLRDEAGQRREIAVGAGEDLMPSWHPTGKELVYLAEFGERRVAQ